MRALSDEGWTFYLIGVRFIRAHFVRVVDFGRFCYSFLDGTSVG